MFIEIMVATMAADPAVALEPRDHLVPVGLQLRMATVLCANICVPHPAAPVKQNASFIEQHCRIALSVWPFFPGFSQPYTWAAAVLVD